MLNLHIQTPPGEPSGKHIIYTNHLPLEGGHSFIRLWSEKTCFRMRDRAAISEYVVSYTIGTDMLQHNNIFSVVALTH